MSGRADDDCWGGHGPWWRGPAARPALWTWAAPGIGGHRSAGQWTLHGHEESSDCCAWTLSAAPTDRHTLQPTAGSGNTKVPTELKETEAHSCLDTDVLLWCCNIFIFKSEGYPGAVVFNTSSICDDKLGIRTTKNTRHAFVCRV